MNRREFLGGATTRALSNWPNAVTFSGRSLGVRGVPIRFRGACGSPKV